MIYLMNFGHQELTKIKTSYDFSLANLNKIDQIQNLDSVYNLTTIYVRKIFLA